MAKVFGELVSGAFSGALKGIMRELSINPRDIRLVCELDDIEHLLARVDAASIRDLLSRPAKKRKFVIRVGSVRYEVDLPARGGPAVGAAPKQRGSR